MRKTSLEGWISEKITGLRSNDLTLEQVRKYQLERLRSVIDYASEKSDFYRWHLRGRRGNHIRTLNDIASLPFTTVQDLQRQWRDFLCISQNDVERVVTLKSANDSESLRRIFFSGSDLELTIDFFHQGMSAIVRPGQSVLILLPDKRPGSVGDLLGKALRRSGNRGFIHGVVLDPSATIAEVIDKKTECLVGIPTQVLALARNERAHLIPAGLIQSVLLSSDYVPAPLVQELKRRWHCQVFGHYGTTEMGFGGGVECDALDGYHLREADLFLEIVDPVTGAPVTPGQTGEVVFTTFTRTAMPFIRYRTGDLSRFLTDRCPCGTVLPRLAKVRGKIHEMVKLRSGDLLTMPDLDEALFPIPGIINYSVQIKRTPFADRITLIVHDVSQDSMPDPGTIVEAVRRLPTVGRALERKELVLEPIRFSPGSQITTSAAKRTIMQE